jgi:hypothetical protein
LEEFSDQPLIRVTKEVEMAKPRAVGYFEARYKGVAIFKLGVDPNTLSTG